MHALGNLKRRAKASKAAKTVPTGVDSSKAEQTCMQWYKTRADCSQPTRGNETVAANGVGCVPKIAPTCFMELTAVCQQLLEPLLLSSLE